MTLQQQVKEFYTEGCSMREIGRRLELSHSKVSKLLDDSGLKPEKKVVDPEWIDRAIELSKSGFSVKEISIKLLKSNCHVRNVLLKNGVVERTHEWTSQEQQDLIIDLYQQGYSCNKIADIVNLSKTTVKKFVPKEMKRPKQFYNTYNCNYSFFDNIDNEVKAYFLGLFYADGYNCEDKAYIRLGFAKKDSELLYKFKEAIESNHPVGVREREDVNHQDFYSLTICSRVLSDALVKHGCMQAKTHLLDKMPEMEESLIRHFIRGYFDGDGSAYYTKSRGWDRLSLSWTGTKPFLEDMQAFLIKELDVTKTAIYITHPDRNNLIGDLRYSNGTATKIHDWMYSDCQYYSERKKNIPAVKKQKVEDYKNSVLSQINLFQLN